MASCSCDFLFLGFWASPLPLSPFMWLPVHEASFFWVSGHLVSLCLPACGFPLPGFWPCRLLFSPFMSAFISLHVASCPFMWLPASCCRVSGNLVSLCLPACGCVARFLGISSPFVSLHVASCCRVPRHLVSFSLPSCLPLPPFMWLPVAGFRHILSPFVSLMWLPFAGFLGISSPFVSLHAASCCRGFWASRLPLSPFMWLPVAGFRGILSPFVSLHICLCLPSCGFLFLGFWASRLPLCPFMWLPVAGFLGISSAFVCLHVASCCWVSGHVVLFCLPSCGFLLPGSEASCLLLSDFMSTFVSLHVASCCPDDYMHRGPALQSLSFLTYALHVLRVRRPRLGQAPIYKHFLFDSHYSMSSLYCQEIRQQASVPRPVGMQ